VSQNGQSRFHGLGWSKIIRAAAQPLLIVATLAVTPSPAAATDGNLLHQMCNSGDSHGRSICMGYVRGVSDTFRGLSAAYGDRVQFCLPESAHIVRQMTDVVSQYLIRNPASRDLPAFLIIGSAFLEAWPCSSRR
jgi:hypothetical protein